MSARVVIACYRPRHGCQEALAQLVRTHVPRLRELGLVTEREPICMVAADGTVVEVFEWRSQEAIARAHEDPVVQALWKQFEALCEWLPVGSLPEAAELFSEFRPLNGA